jgi:hypothetical protein
MGNFWSHEDQGYQLHDAVFTRDKGMALHLIGNGVDPNWVDSYVSPLALAC